MGVSSNGRGLLGQLVGLLIPVVFTVSCKLVHGLMMGRLFLAPYRVSTAKFLAPQWGHWRERRIGEAGGIDRAGQDTTGGCEQQEEGMLSCSRYLGFQKLRGGPCLPQEDLRSAMGVSASQKRRLSTHCSAGI